MFFDVFPLSLLFQEKKKEKIRIRLNSEGYVSCYFLPSWVTEFDIWELEQLKSHIEKGATKSTLQKYGIKQLEELKPLYKAPIKGL